MQPHDLHPCTELEVGEPSYAEGTACRSPRAPAPPAAALVVVLDGCVEGRGRPARGDGRSTPIDPPPPRAHLAPARRRGARCAPIASSSLRLPEPRAAGVLARSANSTDTAKTKIRTAQSAGGAARLSLMDKKPRACNWPCPAATPTCTYITSHTWSRLRRLEAT